MKVISYRFPASTSRTDTFTLFPLGDVHIGSSNCAEKQFRKVVASIQADPHARWFGGGDLLNAVILQDAKRFDPASLPNWMLTENRAKIISLLSSGELSPEALANKLIALMSSGARRKIADMVEAEAERLLSILKPIAGKCIGLIEGNHEFAMAKHHNRDVMSELCGALKAPYLSDCCFVRFEFERSKSTGAKPESTTIRMFAMHGHGGGRSAGAEPNHLARLAQDKSCELLLRGHSHTQFIMPPIARLTIPTAGALGGQAESEYMRAANWGCYLMTYAEGNPTYDSRAAYPVRPLSTVNVTFTPFRSVGNRTRPKIKIEEHEM